MGRLGSGEARRAVGRHSRHSARSRRPRRFAFGHELLDRKLPYDPDLQRLPTALRELLQVGIVGQLAVQKLVADLRMPALLGDVGQLAVQKLVTDLRMRALVDRRASTVIFAF